MSETKYRVKHAAFTVIISIIIVSLFLAIYAIHKRQIDPVTIGKKINLNAWERSYMERGLPIPQNGPREGYWGSRLGKKISHPILGWHESGISISNLLEIDQKGFQRYLSIAEVKFAHVEFMPKFKSVLFNVIFAAIPPIALYTYCPTLAKVKTFLPVETADPIRLIGLVKVFMRNVPVVFTASIILVPICARFAPRLLKN